MLKPFWTAILLFLPIYTILKKISFPDFKKVRPSLRTRGKLEKWPKKLAFLQRRPEFVAVFCRTLQEVSGQ